MRTLDDLYDAVRDRDVEDPACMDMILEYYEELSEESDGYIQLLVKKLENVTISWNTPWYQVPNAIRTKIVPPEDLNEGDTYIKGTFTRDECDRVEKNWRKFVKKFDVPNKIECYARWKNKAGECRRDTPVENVRRFVASYLARGLKRTVGQVYKHVVSYYSRPKKGSYKKDEQKILDICLHHDPKRAPVIVSQVLAREPRALYNKLSCTVNGKPEKKRIKWNLDLATKLLKLLLKFTGESLPDLKNKRIGIEIWRQLEGDFDTQGEYLRHFWYTTLHCQLFCKCDVTLRRIRRRVFKILRRNPYRVWTDIKWKDVAAELPDGLTPQFIYWVTIRLFSFDKKHNYLPMDELVQYGLEKVRNKRRGNKRLRTLILNNEGNLEVHKYDEKF